jgi:hypothetical protein
MPELSARMSSGTDYLCELPPAQVARLDGERQQSSVASL